jgi:hypothetical protein
MRNFAALLAVLAGLCSASCQWPRFRPVTRLMSRAQGESKWFRVVPGPVVTTVNEDVRREQDEQLERYEQQFSLLWLERDTSCAALTGRQAPGTAPVYILVHGIGGDGPEWWPVIPTLDQTHPSAIFMFKWSPAGQHRELLETLTAGVLRISECYPNAAPLVVLCHSAGGVIASFAVHEFKVPQLPSGPRLHVLTVASPLAGTGYRSGQDNQDDESDLRLIYELGAAQVGYQAAPYGVSVIHFRTQFPSDKVMKPNMFGHIPNERGIGVAGAREVDLPAELTHESSLLYVAQELVAGRAL